MFIVVNKSVDFSRWLQAERAKRGWSQSDLGRRSDLNRAVINNIESGRAAFPAPQTLLALAGAFDIPPETMFEIAGLLPEKPAPDRDTAELLWLAERLPPEDQQDLIAMARAKLERRAVRTSRKAP